MNDKAINLNTGTDSKGSLGTRVSHYPVKTETLDCTKVKHKMK